MPGPTAFVAFSEISVPDSGTDALIETHTWSPTVVVFPRPHRPRSRRPAPAHFLIRDSLAGAVRHGSRASIRSMSAAYRSS